MEGLLGTKTKCALDQASNSGRHIKSLHSAGCEAFGHDVSPLISHDRLRAIEWKSNSKQQKATDNHSRYNVGNRDSLPSNNP